MSPEPCAGCGRSVHVAGGIADLWTFGSDRRGGLTLELGDGSEFFLCYDCIEALPEEPSAADVEGLPDRT